MQEIFGIATHEMDNNLYLRLLELCQSQFLMMTNNLETTISLLTVIRSFPLSATVNQTY